MKNLQVSWKLLISFSIAVALTIIVGIMGMYGMTSMDEAAHNMYAKQATPLGDLLTATDYYQRLRVQVRNAIIYTGKTEQLMTVESEMRDRMNRFETAMDSYKPSIATDAGFTLYNAVYDNYNDIFKPGILAVLEGAKRGDSRDVLLDEMADTTIAANQIAVDLSNLGQARLNVMQNADLQNSALGTRLFFIIIAVIVVSALSSAMLAVYISRLISKPLGFISKLLEQFGQQGDLTLDASMTQSAETFSRQKDEIGLCTRMLNGLVSHLTDIEKTLGLVADGDLTVDIDILSARDNIGQSVQKMINNLNSMFAEIQSSTTQVSTGARQISDGSQTLAQGSTQQSAAAQELSSAISEVARKTKENADMASKAANLAETIKNSAEKGSSQMDHMMTAVREINVASQSINNVIKVIDDIAFQTNILALNAAVEAARAGQHGKGFAVVAEEVRNLAAKSAEAAKDTGGLIANSMEKAELGARIADETAASLAEIVSGINESNLIVSEIAKSSSEQTAGISQINNGIEQVVQVIQQNSAAAEQSAAASVEMSEQSNILEQLIAQFKLKEGSVGNYKNLSVGAPKKLLSQKSLGVNDNEYGKY